MSVTEIEKALSLYESQWTRLKENLVKAGLKERLLATAVGWKVADRSEHAQAVNELLKITSQLHVGTVNDRFITSGILGKPLIMMNIPIIKVLQRRPGSNDLLGLDHVDFLVKDLTAAKDTLNKINATWQEESNDVHSWLSIRFGKDNKYEAKFVDHVVLRACIVELKEQEHKLLDKL